MSEDSTRHEATVVQIREVLDDDDNTEVLMGVIALV
jgi:hypothetical protein